MDDIGTQRHPIAIVGIGCRLPGDVNTPSQLWDLLRDGKSGHGPIPKSRFNADGFLHSDPERPGSIHSKGGYFIQSDIRGFENTFFGIHNLEANTMDPQQRKLLEVVYESFENAGARLEDVSGSNTGVFVGNFTNDYLVMQYKDPEYFGRYSATGASPTVLSNRITYCFDLRGPSVVLDTACSSSLYALHSACLSLDAYDCNAAVVASANLIQTAEQQMIAVKAGILSPDGVSHSFDEAANGYGRAEGVSSLYLKRLDDAIANGDPIRAVIRGTAVNGNGKTPGIVQPSVKGQEAVMRTAYRRAKLQPDKTSYVELHGTGTKVGDPIEVEAVSRVFKHRSGAPILVGGIKPALGHSEGASGISSIIKMVLAFENNTIPATIGIEKVNSSIKLEEWNVDIVRENRPWPPNEVRRVGVNSFGFGGANGHVILEAAPTSTHVVHQNGHTNGVHQTGEPTDEPHQNGSSDNLDRLSITLFSASTDESLLKQFNNVATYVTEKGNQLQIKDLEYTLNCRRSRLATRGFLVAPTSSFQTEIGLLSPTIQDDKSYETLDLTFVYTGQGAQWPGLGWELIHRFPSFQRSIRYFDKCLQALDEAIRPSWTIEETILSKDAKTIHRSDRSQPICTAVQVALTDLLREWNIRPRTVLGHSSGEIAAAYAGSYISARQAILSSYLRGLSVSLNKEQGAMMATGLNRDQAQNAIDELGLTDAVTVACVNSPGSTTLSGNSLAIDKLLSVLQERGTFARKLRTGDKAYHSHHMRAVGPVYEELLQRVWNDSKPNGKANDQAASTVRMISSVTKTNVTGAEVATPQYWRENLESPVEFEAAVSLALENGPTHFIEIGPHSTLELPIKEIVNEVNGTTEGHLYHSALSRGKDSSVSVLNLVGSLYIHRHDEISFQAILESGNNWSHEPPRVIHDLPAYPWDYTSSCPWNESRAVTEFRNRKNPRHDLLGSQLPGASKANITWRNVLNIEEISWLKDHKLGPSIVLPAAAYIAMAVEAVCQVNDIMAHECPGVTLKNISFLKAMDFHPEQRPQIEVFTELEPLRLSNTTTSNKWWRFSVSSISRDQSQSTTHAVCIVGLSSLTEAQASTQRRINLDRSLMEQQATHMWYERFTQEGLNWGPQFAVMKDIFSDSARKECIASATTHLVQEEDVFPPGDGHLKYIVHPINIDALLQTAFVATTRGWARDLRATLPVSIETVQVSSPASLDLNAAQSWFIDSTSEPVGFGTINIDAEMINESDQVLVSMRNVRAIRFQGNARTETPKADSPIVRVTWRPDVTVFRPGPNKGFSQYLDWFTKTYSRDESIEASDVRLAAALDLIAFKWPNLRILAVDCKDETISLFKDVLRDGHRTRRYETFERGTIADDGKLHSMHEDVYSNNSAVPNGLLEFSEDVKFDIVVTSNASKINVSSVLDALAPSGYIVCPQDLEQSITQESRFEIVTESHQQDSAVLMGRPKPEPIALKAQTGQVILVHREEPSSPLNKSLQTALSSLFNIEVPVLAFEEVSKESIPPRAIIVSAIEASAPLLNTISSTDLKRVQILTNRAAKIMWITNGDFVLGGQPDHALIRGIAGPLMLEQPALKLQIYDIDNPTSNVEATAENVAFAVKHLFSDTAVHEPEIAQKDGVVHTLRWEAEDLLNEQFELKQDEGITDMALRDIGRAELSIKDPGQFETIHFAVKEFQDALATDHVEVQVKSVGINAKDLYALGARVDTKDASCSCECAGVVVAVGDSVQDVKVGDRVVVMAPRHFATHERVPEWAVSKLNDNEDFNTFSTIPLVFATAIYGLQYRANLQPGESILIHSASGGVGIAAIQLAKNIGAEIFATVGNDTKKEYLVQNFGLNPDHIFSSRDSSFLSGVLAATGGRGVDVVLNSLVGDLLHDSFKACADFGRFIEIGKKDILEHGNLDMAPFSRNVSFTAFDLSALYYSDRPAHNKLWQKLLKESLELIRSKIASPCTPLQVFDAANIEEAFRYFSRGTRMGKVAVSFQNPDSKLAVRPDRYATKFDSNKSYLMIGCLGGLGRSLTKWMMSRGARRFVFLGRTATDKPAARTLVENLRSNGADVEVVRGDVGIIEDVERSIRAAKTPIGGVIQGAMALRESIWTDMTDEYWHRVIRPKVQGTWNLHNLLAKDGRDAQLDFFVMTSSTAGSIGAATESNYCAANAFLDAFARYRQSLGLPAVAIGYGRIAEVGYLHEHPDIELIMERRGIQAINEDEMIQIMDIAIAYQHSDKWMPRYDQLSNTHLLTGIDFSGLQLQRDRGFEGDIHVLSDPRASLFAAAFERNSAAAGGIKSALTSGLPAEVAQALADGGAETTLLDAVRNMVGKKIANLILLPFEKLRMDQKLGDFGMDSMLAAEFRTYIFHALEVDVPFMMLLDKSTTVNSLSTLVVDTLKSRQEE